MKGVGWVLLTLGAVMVLGFLIASGACVNKRLEVGKDIGAPLNRAQVASNPEDMDKFLGEVQEGLENHGYTSGHWQPYNQNVDNDFGVVYQAILSIRSRLETVKTFDEGSVEYQVAMDDLRGTIRELDIGQQSAVKWSFWWIWLLLTVGVILMLIGGGIAFYDSY